MVLLTVQDLLLKLLTWRQVKRIYEKPNPCQMAFQACLRNMPVVEMCCFSCGYGALCQSTYDMFVGVLRLELKWTCYNENQDGQYVNVAGTSCG